MELHSFVQLVGGLGIFLFGMKLMSESLQQAAGENLKKLLNNMTANKFAAVLSGAAITTTIQSSSATTVLVVGFVNAALLNIRQAIGVIMGANIGTTVTAWLVAFLGFKFKISTFALPAIALGVVFLFLRKERFTGWGNALIGFGFLFLGIYFLKGAVPDYKSDPEAFAALQQYADMGFLSVLLFVGIGTLLTIVVQSSSATAAITLTLALKGQISPELAMAMILGENIGTTITANLAALAGNINAKKAALAHTLFNMFGVSWALLFFPFLTGFVTFLLPGDPLNDTTILGYRISAFHTGFNLLNTALLIWFIPTIEKTVDYIMRRFTPATGDEKSAFKFLSGGSVRSTELALFEITSHCKTNVIQALNEFKKIKELILEKYDEQKAQEIFEQEEILDKNRSEMLAYLSEVQRSGVTGETATNLLATFEYIRILELIGDNLSIIARKLKRANKNDISIPGKKNRKLIQDRLLILEDQYNLLHDCISQKSALKVYSRGKSTALRKEAKKMVRRLEKRLQKQKQAQKHDTVSLILLADISQVLDNISRCLNDMVTATK